MATNPKVPVEQRPRLQVVATHANRPPRIFSVIVVGVAALIVAAVILVAIWLLRYGGGSPQEQPKPHQATGTPAGLSAPVLPRI